MVARALSLCLILLSAAADELHVEADGEGLIARSPADQGNFLFRLPKGYRRVDPPEGWQLAFETPAEPPRGAVRLRYAPLEAAEVGRGLGELASARTLAHRKELGAKGEPRIEGGGARRRALLEGKLGDAGVSRIVLYVRDADRIYELVLDETPPGTERGTELSALADGFTILEPHALPQETAATGDVKARELSHDFYRVTLLKPEGFAEETVDPEREPGLIFSFRRRDAQNNLATIRVHAFLARTSEKTAAERAQAALDSFFQRHPEGKGPRKATRSGYAGAKDALRWQATAKQGTSMIVFQEDRLILEHGNGWIYEIEVVTFAAAQKEFRKALSAFWQSLRFAAK